MPLARRDLAEGGRGDRGAQRWQGPGCSALAGAGSPQAGGEEMSRKLPAAAGDADFPAGAGGLSAAAPAPPPSLAARKAGVCRGTVPAPRARVPAPGARLPLAFCRAVTWLLRGGASHLRPLCRRQASPAPRPARPGGTRLLPPLDVSPQGTGDHGDLSPPPALHAGFGGRAVSRVSPGPGSTPPWPSPVARQPARRWGARGWMGNVRQRPRGCVVPEYPWMQRIAQLAAGFLGSEDSSAFIQGHPFAIKSRHGLNKRAAEIKGGLFSTFFFFFFPNHLEDALGAERCVCLLLAGRRNFR